MDVNSTLLLRSKRSAKKTFVNFNEVAMIVGLEINEENNKIIDFSKPNFTKIDLLSNCLIVPLFVS